MKAIIPVAGVGNRLKPLTDDVPKVLLNVAGKPMLGHLIDKLLEAGIDDMIFITGYLGEKVISYVKENYPDVKAVFAHQEERKGTAHAVQLAEPYANGPVFIVFGDTLFEGSLKKVIKTKRGGLIGVCPTNDPKRFGIIETKGKKITRLVEKPEVPPSNLAIIGMYLINDYKLLFNSINYIMSNGIKTKGEYQLTDALQLMVEKGADIGFFNVKWLDCGQPETFMETNREILNRYGKKDEEKIGNSRIIHPSSVGVNVSLENSVIGPYAVISDNCKIKNSKIENSIIDKGSLIDGCNIKGFMIGANSRFEKEARSSIFIEIK